jgi:hypothetical protein
MPDIGIEHNGMALTFIVHASRGDETLTTIRLSPAAAIAKGHALAAQGWTVFITGPDDVRHDPSEFDRLLSLGPVSPLRT